MTSLRINLVGAGEGAPCPRLLAALAAAYDVDFLPLARHCPEPDAVVAVGGAERNPWGSVPAVVYEARCAQPGTRSPVQLADAPGIDRPFRGRTLEDAYLPAGGSLVLAGAEMPLAEAGGRVLWAVSRDPGAALQRVGVPLPYLAEGQALRDLFRPGRFLALLPLVQLLARLRAERGWRRPGPRAALLIDDPNLHDVRYGYIDFREAAARARRRGYHVAFAMIPLDTWYSSARAVQLFREHSESLSLVIHGNDHLREELGRPLEVATYEAIVAQALRRIDRFERATGVAVARIMAAPHGRCAEAAATALHRTGYDALCISRPYPWLSGPPPDRPLAGWLPADHVVGGLPVLPRYGIARDTTDLVFRAWLGQPLVVYGHHGDARSGYERIDAAAGFINGLGDVRWLPLAEIARTNFETRVAAGRLSIRAFAARFELTVPAGVGLVEVEMPAADRSSAQMELWIDGSRRSSLAPVRNGRLISETVMVAAGPAQVRLQPSDLIDYRRLSGPRRSLWPPVRRVLTESRDRLVVLARR